MNKEMPITEILQDHSFIDALKLTIKQIEEHRDARTYPPIGCKYKTDWVDRLQDSGNFNVEFFLAHIEDVLRKKSHLNSETRMVVDFIFKKSFSIYLKSKL